MVGLEWYPCCRLKHSLCGGRICRLYVDATGLLARYVLSLCVCVCVFLCVCVELCGVSGQV